MNYIPNQKDIIWIDFQPSRGQELRGRHPAVVLSLKGYSIMTNLVAICPITDATNNRLRDYFLPIAKLNIVKNYHKKVHGVINPLQFYTFDIDKRHTEYTGLALPTKPFLKIIKIHKQILGQM